MPNLDLIITDCEDLSCHTGVTFNISGEFSNECTGIPDDLSGYTCKLTIFNETEENIIDEIDGDMSESNKGIVTFNIPAATTQNYDVGMFKHHIELKINATVYRVAQGYFEVSE